MRRHHLASVSLVLAAAWALAAPLLLTSCGDDSQGASPSSGGAAGSGGVGAGGLGMSGGSAATAGTDGTGGSTGGSAAGGAAGSGGASAGAGGKGGAGGAGGVGGVGGNGGAGGNPVVRVYTIEGCDVSGAGGAGGAAGAGGASDAGGADGVAGATDAGGAGGAAGPGPLPNVFASFTVYNFETDQPVQTCVDKVDDFTITITGDAPITVATNIAPGVGPASVVWTYDGVAQGPHNIFPYSLGPDDNGNYQEPTPPLAVGVHNLIITAYDEIDGMGNVLGTATVKVTVIDGA